MTLPDYLLTYYLTETVLWTAAGVMLMGAMIEMMDWKWRLS